MVKVGWLDSSYPPKVSQTQFSSLRIQMKWAAGHADAAAAAAAQPLSHSEPDSVRIRQMRAPPPRPRTTSDRERARSFPFTPFVFWFGSRITEQKEKRVLGAVSQWPTPSFLLPPHVHSRMHGNREDTGQIKNKSGRRYSTAPSTKQNLIDRYESASSPFACGTRGSPCHFCPPLLRIKVSVTMRKRGPRMEMGNMR